MAKLWKVPQRKPKELKKPVQHHQYLLEAYAANDLVLFKKLMTKYRKTLGIDPIANPRDQGSWNKRPMEMLALTVDGNKKARKGLRTYFRRQLRLETTTWKDKEGTHTGKHYLWGTETFSRAYWWGQLVVGAMAHNWGKKNDPTLAKLARDLMRAHVDLLALFTLPEPHQKTPWQKCHCAVPGQRSWEPYADAVQLSFAMARILAIKVKPKLPAFKKPWGWAMRIMDRTPQGYLNNAERKALRKAINTGKVKALVQRLRKADVRTLPTLHAWRYKNGDACFLTDRRVHGTRAPTLAATKLGATYQALVPPASGKNQQTSRKQKRVIATYKQQGQAEQKEIPAPPLQGKALLYHVRVNTKGVKLL